MVDRFSIAEISRITGLASHTLRYYEQQFPTLLNVERSRGGHRIYRQQHLENLNRIIKLLKEDKVSIRRARQILLVKLSDTDNGPDDIITAQENEKIKTEASQPDLSGIMIKILEKLDSLCKKNEKRDQMLYDILCEKSIKPPQDLLAQISRCRSETQETVKLCNILLSRNSMAN